MRKNCLHDAMNYLSKVVNLYTTRFGGFFIARRSPMTELDTSTMTEQEQMAYIRSKLSDKWWRMNREFNFEVRHSPMPPDGTLRIP